MKKTRWLLFLMGVSFLFLKGHSALLLSSSPSSSSSLSSSETTSPISRRLLVRPSQENQHRHHYHHHHHNLHHHSRHRSVEDTNHQISGSGHGSSSTTTLNESLALQDYPSGSERKPISTQQWQHQRLPPQPPPPPPPPPPSPSTFYYNNNNNNNIHFKPIESPQVPEQLPIVVSSSDNSYVSASPVIIETTPPPSAGDADYWRQRRQQQQHGRPHLRTAHLSTPTDSRRLFTDRIKHYNGGQDSDLSMAEEERKHRPGSTRRKNQLYWPPSSQTDSTSSSDRLDDKISSTSDISTTATTTPRINDHHTSGSPVAAAPLLEFSAASLPTEKPESLISRFEIKLATIINTQESIDAGATFINYTVVTNFDACLVECWITDSCDTAVYQESKIASSSSPSLLAASSAHDELTSIRLNNNLQARHKFNGNSKNQPDSMDGSSYHICFLFECVKSQGFMCQFSPHDNYVSAILTKKISNYESANDEDEVKDIKLNDKYTSDDVATFDEEKQFTSRADCESKLKFKCLLQLQSKPECIETNQRCDGTIDCSDGSDEFDCYKFAKESANTIDVERVFVPLVGYSIRDASNEASADGLEATASTSKHIHEYSLISQDHNRKPGSEIGPDIQPAPGVHYSRIVHSHNHHPLNDHHRLGQWHDTRVASIRIGEYEDYEKGGLNSALIAILFGMAITGMLIVIVGHKMRSIRRRLAYKSRRRSLVPEKELFISTMSI